MRANRQLLERMIRGTGPARLYLLALLLLGSFAGSTPVCAEPGPKVESLTVALWPEFDRPAMLVTYRVRLAPDTPLPSNLRLRIPATVGTPHAVAKGGGDGGLYLAEYTREVAQDWATLDVVADSLQIQVEYYAGISQSGHRREYAFVWPGGLDIAQYAYEVMEPPGAVNFAVTPPPSSQRPGPPGTKLHLAPLGALQAAQQVTISVAYDRSMLALTAAVQPAPKPPVPAPARQAPAPSSPGMSSGEWVAVVFGTIVIVFGLVLFLGQKNASASSSDGEDDS